MTSAEDAIRELYRREKAFYENNKKDRASYNNPNDPDALVGIAKTSFLREQQFFAGKNEHWSQMVYDRPLLPQLLFHSQLIVDIITETEAEFEERLGVSVPQFKRLIQEGFVIPNLAYDSEYMNRDESLWDNLSDSPYAGMDFLPEILSPDESFATINRFRRNHIFDAMGFGPEFRKNQVDEFDKLLSKHITQESAPDLNRMNFGMPTKDLRGAIEKLSYNLMYIDAFSTFFGLPQDVKEIFNFAENRNNREDISLIEWIGATKTDVCGQLTATLGGIQAIGPSEFMKIQKSRHGLANVFERYQFDQQEERTRLEQEDTAFAFFMMMLSQMREERLDLVSKIEIKIPIKNDRVFESFLSFLKFVKPYRTEMDQLFVASKLLIDDEEKARHYLNYHRAAKKVIEEARKSPALDQVIAASVSGGVAAGGLAVVTKGMEHLEQDGPGRVTSQLCAESISSDRRECLLGILGVSGAAAASGLAKYAEILALDSLRQGRALYRGTEINRARSVVLQNTKLFGIR